MVKLGGIFFAERGADAQDTIAFSTEVEQRVAGCEVRVRLGRYR